MQIYHQVQNSKFVPDLIVGLSRGGLVPAVELSHLFDIPLKVIDVTTREKFTKQYIFDLDYCSGKKALVVDDVCDSGVTLKLIQPHFPKDSDVRFACCFNKINENDFDLDYCGEEITDNRWITFPWEP